MEALIAQLKGCLLDCSIGTEKHTGLKGGWYMEKEQAFSAVDSIYTHFSPVCLATLLQPLLLLY